MSRGFLVGACQPSPCCSFAPHLIGKMFIHCSFAHHDTHSPGLVHVAQMIVAISSTKITSQIPGIPTTIKTMCVNITTIVYLRVLIIEIGSTIILMVVEAQGNITSHDLDLPPRSPHCHLQLWPVCFFFFVQKHSSHRNCFHSMVVPGSCKRW